MSEYYYRFEKKTGYCKIFKWENGKDVYVMSLGTAEKLYRKLVRLQKLTIPNQEKQGVTIPKTKGEKQSSQTNNLILSETPGFQREIPPPR